MLYPGSYTITMSFTGKITAPMTGLYPCNFEAEGQPKILLATQFESHFARQVFPCIDEPEAKATFALKLEAPDSGTLIANTPVKAASTKAGRQSVLFETTPKMSTYLLAFVYGDLEFLESKTKAGVTVRSYATGGNVKFTKFALDMAVKCLDFYNDYYDIPYPLAKCDLVALPDFGSGAMENWGCITFREQALLVDPKNSSLPVKQYVALVVAHELAHQWFGNLVTMRWWTDLWLNEGFASWMEYLAVDHMFPDWNIWMDFVSNEQEAGLRLDGLENTHPIEVPIKHPDEIKSIFDTISYSKGSSVLLMLYRYLGPKDFQTGLQQYLKKHAYSNTDTVDLWAALEAASHKPVKSFMHTWTSKPGFPVIHTDISQDELKLNQARFYLNPNSPNSRDVDWPVPILPSQPIGLDILKTKASSVKKLKLDSQFIINQGRGGFYRVVYNPEHVARLAGAISEGKISVIDRLAILSDAFETARAGQSNTADALTLLKSYASEDDTFVWEAMAGGLAAIRSTMNDNALREAMKPFARQLVAKQLKRLGWQPKASESHFDTLLRPTILGLASISDDKAIVDEAKRQFKQAKRPDEINPDLRGVVYGTVARTGDKTVFDKLLKLHNSSKSSEDRLTFTAALTGFKQPELIERALSQIISKDVRLQDAPYWLAFSFMNRYARDMTWLWLVEHWDWLEKNLSNDLSFSRFPIYAARVYSDADFLVKYNAFFKKHQNPSLERAVKQGVEIIEWQSAWRKRDLKAIKGFFKA
jgi:puromycin-sensitive aminopeptidase